jgi:hypothetical protein
MSAWGQADLQLDLTPTVGASVPDSHPRAGSKAAEVALHGRRTVFSLASCAILVRQRFACPQIMQGLPSVAGRTHLLKNFQFF